MTLRTTERPRILLLAFGCFPNAGSEPGVGWNRALSAARHFDTWVLCNEEESRAPIEQFLAEHGPIANLRFVYVPADPGGQKLWRLPGMYYVMYNRWHRRAYKIATKLHAEQQFDLVHQVNLCGFREPGYLWKLDAPFVWGPVGGAQNFPWRFLGEVGWLGAAREVLRSFINNVQLRFAPRVGRAAHRTPFLLAATTTNARLLARRSSAAPRVMLETGVNPPANLPVRTMNHDGPLRLMWSGMFQHHKALPLLFRALAELPKDVDYELHILGKGPQETLWRKQSRQLNIEPHCHWLGWVDHARAMQVYQHVDAFVFTSLRDTSGNVVLESLANGTPVLCLDHQGMADIVTDDCGVKLPVTTPRKVVAGLRDTLIDWHRHRHKLERLSHGAQARVEQYSWARQGERMTQVYREVLGIHGRVDSLPQAERRVTDDFCCGSITEPAGFARAADLATEGT